MKKFKKIISILLSLITIILPICGAKAENSVSQTGFDAIRNSLDLVWSDEFNENSLDMTKWRFETPYSTACEQVYCDSVDDGNISFENGNLIIETKKETKEAYIIEDELGKKITTYDSSNGGEKATFNYTSARLYSNIDNAGANSFKRGMIEAKIKIPSFGGIFPAFWTTGYDHINETYRTWPNTGEIDILESLNTSGKYSNNSVQQSVHYSYNDAHKNSLSSYYSAENKTGDDYHTFGVYYSQSQVVFYVDDGITGAYSISSSEFDAFRTYAQNLILNVAVGVNSATVSQNKVDSDFTASKMYIDYVRVYQSATDDYNHINIINAEDCSYINASTANYSTLNKPTVVTVSDSSVITTDEFDKGTYDVYATSLDTAESGNFSFEVNDIPTSTEVDFGETSGANQHYIGTVKLNESSSLSLKFSNDDSANANIDSLIIVGNSENTPNVIIDVSSLSSTYSFEVEDLTINAIDGTSTTASYTETDFKGKEFLVFDASAAGAILKDDYIELILPDLTQGAYELVTYNRMWGNRSIFDISVNGEVQLQNVDFAKTVSAATYEAINCGTITVNESGDILLRFTVTSDDSTRNSGFYMDKLELIPITGTNILTIDGTSRKVTSGIYYTLPDSEADGFAAYTDGENYYYQGDKIIIDKDISLTTIAVGEIFMLKGASIRLNNKNGIRFYTNIDKEKISLLRADGYTVELGTLISPIDLLGENELAYSLSEGKYADVAYTSTQYYSDSSGFSGIVGSIVDINESNTAYSALSGNITRNFVGRGYIRLSKNGQEIAVVYADYSEDDITNNSRSLKEVANALINDTSTSAQAIYSLNKELVDKWATAEK